MVYLYLFEYLFIEYNSLSGVIAFNFEWTSVDSIIAAHLNCVVLRCVSLSVGRRLASSKNITTKNGIRTLDLGMEIAGGYLSSGPIGLLFRNIFASGAELNDEHSSTATTLYALRSWSTTRDDSKSCVKFETVSEGDDLCAALKLAGVCIVGKCQMLLFLWWCNYQTTVY